MSMKVVKLKDLIYYENNAKEHPQEQIDKIKKSITAFGFRGGIKVSTDNIIIVGHGRVAALIQLGVKSAEVSVIDDLSKEGIIAYRIADNKTAESGWDYDKLAENLRELSNAPDFDIGTTCLNEYEIDALVKSVEVEDLQAEWVGMPEFQHQDLEANNQVIVSFKNADDRQKFASLINQQLTDKTKSVWFPKVEHRVQADKRYE